MPHGVNSVLSESSEKSPTRQSIFGEIIPDINEKIQHILLINTPPFSKLIECIKIIVSDMYKGNNFFCPRG